MGRAELRRQAKKQNKTATFTMTNKDIDRLKETMTKKAAEELMGTVLGISIMIINDKYPQLMRVNVDGKSREQRFADMFLDLYDSVEKGYLTFEDIRKTLRDECGIVIREDEKDR